MRRNKRLKFVRQTTASDCGVACLATVLQFFGEEVSLSELRALVQSARDGCSAAALLDAARQYNVHGEGVHVDELTVEGLPRPSILHLRSDHFVVLDRVIAKEICFIDPSAGSQSCGRAEFTKRFSGVALIFAAAPPRMARRVTRTNPWREFITQPLRRLRGLLATLVMFLIGARLALLGMVFMLGALLNDFGTARSVDASREGKLTLLGILCVTFMLLGRVIKARFGTSLHYQLLTTFIGRLLSLPSLFFVERGYQELALRALGVSRLRDAAALVSGTMVVDVVTGVVIMTLTSRMGPSALLIAATAAIGNLGLLLVLDRRRSTQLARCMASRGRAESLLKQLVTNADSLRLFGLEECSIKTWERELRQHHRDEERWRWLEGLVQAASLLFNGGAGIVALHVCRGSGNKIGAAIVTTVVALIFSRIASSTFENYRKLRQLSGIAARVDDVLYASERVTPPLAAKPKLSGRLSLEEVSFAFEHSASLFRQVSVDIKAGECIGIVGRSGCGGTTLARLIVGMMQPTTGRVLFDGEDCRGFEPEAFRRQVRLVTENATLIGSTIFDAISGGDPQVSVAAVYDAAVVAGIADDIENLPRKYQSVLVDGGISLSSSQRARIAIARALATSPAVIILDGATATLDRELEAQLMTRLRERGCTIIVVSNQWRILRFTDTCVVLRHGGQVEIDRHERLSAMSSEYRVLVDVPSA